MHPLITPASIRHHLTDPDGISEEALEARIKAVWVKAVAAAPCITDEGFPFTEELEAVLGPVVDRWINVGPGGVTQEQRTVGSFSQSTSFDSRMAYGDRLTRDEKLILAGLCKRWRAGRSGRAFSITPR